MQRNRLSILLLLILLCSGAFSASAQPYQSMFGHEDYPTQWLFVWYNLDIAGIDKAYVEKDTIVHGVTYKKVVSTNSKGSSSYSGGLFREDTLTGHVWYRIVNDPTSNTVPDTTERLAFRFDLNVGDTFDISHTALKKGSYPDSLNIVDSVRVIDGRRYIYFKGLLFDQEPITLIEGVGSNVGIFWKHCSDPSIGCSGGTVQLGWTYLLCHYKNGQQTTYDNRRYDGECNPDLHIGDIGDESRWETVITLYPQPARGTVWVGNDGEHPIQYIQIFTPQGKLVQRSTGDNIKKIGTEGLSSGLYYIKLFSDQGYLTGKPLVID